MILFRNALALGGLTRYSLQRSTMSYYAVAKGRKVGIFTTWTECEEQVKGFKGAVYKKFKTRPLAEQFCSDRNPYWTLISLDPQGVSKPKHQSEDVWPDENELLENDLDKLMNEVEDEPENLINEDDLEAVLNEAEPSTSNAFQGEDLITDDDLNAVMNEVEGFPQRKRKMATNFANGPHSKVPRHVSQVSEAVGLKRIGELEFEIDAEGFVIVYTDGSCIGNGRANACAGFGVYFGDNHALNAAKPVLGRVTNNVGEIQAAIFAIKTALDLGIQKLCICTDSQFLINSITMWVKAWKRRGWLLKNNQPVKNVADFKELDQLLQGGQINVKWNYVVAHRGIKGNEMADKLARQGSALYKELHQ